jgi:hypothetical protein
MNDDIEQLRLLTLGHYIGAALLSLVACFPLIHVSIGLLFLINPPPVQSGQPFPSQLFGLMFALIGGALVLGGWTLAACLFAAGRSIAARRRYTFCIVVAALSCTVFPFGTALGVLSLLVLTRPTVKAMFQQVEAQLR